MGNHSQFQGEIPEDSVLSTWKVSSQGSPGWYQTIRDVLLVWEGVLFLYFIKERHTQKTQPVNRTNHIKGASNGSDSITKNPVLICAFWHKTTMARPPFRTPSYRQPGPLPFIGGGLFLYGPPQTKRGHTCVWPQWSNWDCYPTQYIGQLHPSLCR